MTEAGYALLELIEKRNILLDEIIYILEFFKNQSKNNIQSKYKVTEDMTISLLDSDNKKNNKLKNIKIKDVINSLNTKNFLTKKITTDASFEDFITNLKNKKLISENFIAETNSKDFSEQLSKIQESITNMKIKEFYQAYGFSAGGNVLGNFIRAIEKNKSDITIRHAILAETPIHKKTDINFHKKNNIGNKIVTNIIEIGATPECTLDPNQTFDIFHAEGNRSFRKLLHREKNNYRAEINNTGIRHMNFGDSRFRESITEKLLPKIEANPEELNYNLQFNAFNNSIEDVIASENKNQHKPSIWQKASYALSLESKIAIALLVTSFFSKKIHNLIYKQKPSIDKTKLTKKKIINTFYNLFNFL